MNVEIMYLRKMRKHKLGQERDKRVEASLRCKERCKDYNVEIRGTT